MKLRIISILIVLVLFSCSSKPPVNTETENSLVLLEQMIQKAQELKDNDEELEAFMEESGKEDTLAALYENDTIIIRELKRNYSNEAFVYSNGAGEVVVNQDLYVTKNWKGDFLFSLDNENWHKQNINSKEDIENIDFQFDVESNLENDGNTLVISYSWEAILGDNPKVENPGRRETIQLEQGLIFDHNDKKMINTNLNRKSLFVPKGTIVSSRFSINGNLVNSEFNGRDIIVKAKKDLFIYTGDKKVGLSFDNRNWNISIFAFKIKNESQWFASSHREISMNNVVEVLYNK